MQVTIRPLEERDLRGADVVFRLALGTLDGLPAPIRYGGDTDYVSTRWKADPSAAFVAVSGENPVGSVFVSKWGSVAIVGPLTVHPNVWDHAIGTRLMEAAIRLIDRWGPEHAGLHIVTHSAKHIQLFRKFGFWPRCLIEVMCKTVEETKPTEDTLLFSQIPAERRADVVQECRRVTDSIYAGLDLEREIRAAHQQELGDTVLLRDGGSISGFAVCHWGPGTEAGSGRWYIKFGAVSKDPDAPRKFQRLLKACEVLAPAHGASRIVAGVNSARSEACRLLIENGFQTESVGVAMHRPYTPAYNRDDVYVIDDWR